MTHIPQIQPVAPRMFVPPRAGEMIECQGIKYFIGEKIGQGSFGEVYVCRDEWGNELVAKVLLPQNQSYETIRENWLQEFRSLQQLRHPHITFLHQAFEYRDTFYIIVEKCEFTLKVLVDNPDINGEIWVPHVSRDILNGLHYIHDHGYVHKDLHAGKFLYPYRKIQWFQTRSRFGDLRSAIWGLAVLKGISAFSILS